MGTTSDKLSYLSTTKNYIKESINLTNINITNEPFRYYAYAIKKGIINVLNNPKEIWNNFEKVTGEGTSIELTSTENAPMDINLKGNTSQASEPTPTNPIDIHIVSGDNEIKVENRNRFNPNSIEQGGFNYHTGENWSGNGFIRNIIYNLKPNTQYTISCNESLGEAAICCFDENGSALDGYTSGSTTNTYWSFTTKANTSYIKVRIGNATYPKTTSGSYNVCLVEGTSTDYVPHQEYTKEINLPVENLFDKNSVVGGFVNADGTVGGDANAYKTSDFIPIQPNTAYYKTRTDSPRTKYYDSNKQPLNTTTYQDISIGGNEGTFTTPNNACYLRFSYPLASVEPNNIMVHKGTKANSYTPYGTTPIEVGSIGDYDDEFFKNTTDSEYYDSSLEQDKWYLKKRIGKVDLGELSWDSASHQASNYRRYYTNTIPNVKYVSANTQLGVGLCEKYKIHTGRGMGSYGSENCFAIDVSTVQAVDQASPTGLFYYALATPENILLNDTLQETLDSFVSYQEQTNISQENNDLPFILDVEALKLIE